MSYHMIAFAVGFLLDQVVGDPAGIPHPIRGIGWLIRRTEAVLRREKDGISRDGTAEEPEKPEEVRKDCLEAERKTQLEEMRVASEATKELTEREERSEGARKTQLEEMRVASETNAELTEREERSKAERTERLEAAQEEWEACGDCSETARVERDATQATKAQEEREARGERSETARDGSDATWEDRKALRRKGRILCVVVIGLTMLVTAAVVLGAYWLHPVLGCAVEAVLTGQALACKCLKVESMKVAKALERGDLNGAREAVSWIVGRDTAELDESAVARAAIETVAENTSDGVIAPMLCAALGGPILAFGYKAVNTLDSTVGYKNEKYLDFGRCAAKVDDGANWIPSRVSAMGMICGAFLLGKEFSGKNAWKIFRRDRFNHASPNSAQTESVCAGALGIRLAGDAKYFGKVVKKPYIGDELRPVEGKDIGRANRLMYATAWLCAGICLLAIGLAGI